MVLRADVTPTLIDAENMAVMANKMGAGKNTFKGRTDLPRREGFRIVQVQHALNGPIALL